MRKIIILFVILIVSLSISGYAKNEPSSVIDHNVKILLERMNQLKSKPKRTFSSSSTQGNLLWNYQAIDDVECVASFPDVDNDGFPEVLAESYDAGASGSHHFSCISGHSSGIGNLIWGIWPQGGPSNSGGYGDKCVSSISDLDGNTIPDALLGTAWGGRSIYAIDGDSGRVIWYYDTYADPESSGWFYQVNSIPDVDGDGIDDVLACTGRDCQTAFCFSGDSGSIIWRYKANDAIGSICAIDDVNSDTISDALVGAWGNGLDEHIYCISGASRGNPATVLWSYDCNGDVYSVAQIKDVNGNGINDALASCWNDTVFCFEGSTGVPIWKYDIGTIGMRLEPIDDINGDSIQDVVVGSWLDAIIMLSGADGTQIWSTPTDGDIWTVYPIGDVNNDGDPDVIAGSGTASLSGTIYCCDGNDGTIIWTYQTTGWINTVRSIPDVNDDGIDDVIAGNQYRSQPGFVYCIEGDTITTAISENSPSPEIKTTFFNSPNLAKGSVMISYYLARKSNVSIKIFNSCGRLVRTFTNPIEDAGNQSVIWDGKDNEGKQVHSGLYFCLLKVSDKTYTRTISILH
ncbi:MAG: hypothetical protein OEZ20_05015, partial [candidate division WOR-3 bacterium]|nr:hypothetical protein [candidate division WOR-3 bacterium]